MTCPFGVVASGKGNGRTKSELIDKTDLKSVMAYWRRAALKVNLKGEYSQHSLLYERALKHYQKKSFSHKELLTLISMDLRQGNRHERSVGRVYE